MKQNLSVIRLLASYEAKLVFRNWFFRVLISLSILVIWGSQYVLQYLQNEWHRIALPLSVPFFNLYLFTVIQSLLVIFAVKEWYGNEKDADTTQVIYARPVSNTVLILGKSLGVAIAFLIANLLSLMGAAFFNVFISYSPFSGYAYFFYLFTLSLPALIFMIGLSVIVFYFLKNSFLSLILLLGFFLFSLFYLPEIAHGLFDQRATDVPNVLSDIIGLVEPRLYLTQRLFFFFLGMSFLCYTIGGIKRLTDWREKKSQTRIVASLFILAGVLTGYFYERIFIEKDSARENYRALFLKYQDIPIVNMVKQNIEYKGKGKKISVTSRLTIENSNNEMLDKIILYLNPSLKVTLLQEGDRQIPFSREEQCIVIDRSLHSEETLTLTLNYEGDIDDRICYLDVKDEAYNRMQWNDSFLRFGKRYAYTGKDYTFLIPECLWYPVSVPLVNLTNPYANRKNFTRYSLNVISPLGKEVISQGTEETRGDTIIFRNKHDLTGINLCIGDYEKRNIRLDSVNISLYLVKGHGKFLSALDSIKTELPNILKKVKCDIEAKQNGVYPFNKFSMIEVPVSFTSYSRLWKNNDFTQPEMLFFPERWVTQINWSTWMKPGYLEHEETQNLFFERLPELFAEQTHIFGKDIYKLLLPGIHSVLAPIQVPNNQSLSPLFSDYSCYFFSEKYPIVDNVMKKIIHLHPYYENDMFFFLGMGFPYASEYLTSSSFKNLLKDKEIPEREMAEILRLKTFQFLNYITSFISYGEFQSFLKNYMAHSSFKEIFFRDFLDKLQKQFDLDIRDFLIDWYLKDKIPEFRFKDEILQVCKMEKGTCYVFSVKVYNPSEEEGILSVKMGNLRSKNYLIKGKSAYLVRINTFLKRPPTLNKIYTNVSRNIPKSMTFGFGGKHISETSDTSSGIFKIDTTCFRAPDNEIIVDNRDIGCQVIQYKSKSTLANLFGEKMNQEIEYRPIISRFEGDYSPCWAEDIQNNGYYGDIIKSIYYKVAGEGNFKVEWKADLPQAGLYEVYIYNTLPPLRRESDEQYYILKHRDGIENIKVSMGKESSEWTFVGEYRFNVGEAKIILTDKGAYPGQRIIADAVKWVKIGE